MLQRTVKSAANRDYFGEGIVHVLHFELKEGRKASELLSGFRASAQVNCWCEGCKKAWNMLTWECVGDRCWRSIQSSIQQNFQKRSRPEIFFSNQGQFWEVGCSVLSIRRLPQRSAEICECSAQWGWRLIASWSWSFSAVVFWHSDVDDSMTRWVDENSNFVEVVVFGDALVLVLWNSFGTFFITNLRLFQVGKNEKVFVQSHTHKSSCVWGEQDIVGAKNALQASEAASCWQFSWLLWRPVLDAAPSEGHWKS